VPQLLAKWQPQPAVRLAWCCEHNGQFGQPRKSELALRVADAPSASDLVFLGRVADSLYFAVSNFASAPAGYADKSPPGFRYDIVSDSAVVLPEVLPAPAVPITYPAGLPAYPFYAYHDPGAPLFPRDWFAPALVVADALRVHCDFELALKWYSRAFDPLRNDCTWMDCSAAESGSTGGPSSATAGAQGGATSAAEGEQTTSTSGPTVIAVLAQGGSTSAAGAARDETSAGGPAEAAAEAKGGTSSVTTSTSPAAPAAQQSPAAPPTQHPPAGAAAQQPVAAQPSNSAGITSGGTSGGACCDSAGVTRAVARQRALTLRFCETLLEWGEAVIRSRKAPEGFQQARLLFATARIAGPRPHDVMLQPPAAPPPIASFTPAYAALNPRLRDIYARVEDRLALGLSIRQDQWRDADWQVHALQQSKDVSQTHLIYYTGLYQSGLLNYEIQNISLATNATQMRTTANITEAVGEAMNLIPDIFVGFASSGTVPPLGRALAAMFGTIAKVMLTVADVQAETAAIDLTEAGWLRRSNDWFHQTQILPIEIQQIELQILAAHQRRHQAMHNGGRGDRRGRAVLAAVDAGGGRTRHRVPADRRRQPAAGCIAVRAAPAGRPRRILRRMP
jgi:hypothetical protein